MQKRRECGVYKFVHSLTQQVIYIGKTEDSFKNRIDAHYRGKGVDAKFLPYTKDGCEVYIHRLVNNAEKRLVGSLETALINLYKPVLNDVNKCDGLSLYFDLNKLNWERWDTESFQQKDEISCRHNGGFADSCIRAVLEDIDDSQQMREYNSDSIDYPGVHVSYDMDGMVKINLDKCSIVFTGWRSSLSELRSMLQKLWKEWEEYLSGFTGKGSGSDLPRVSKCPEYLCVKIKRGGVFSNRISEGEYGNDGIVKFYRETVWKSLKILDIVLEDSDDKVNRIKELYKELL